MWEKIVLNLLSNAFKFTLRRRDRGVAAAGGRHGRACRSRDTGTGIPAEELPRLFERFHRVEGAQGRTHEGSGIGLALVQELVKLHGGGVAVESAARAGSTFTVTIPFGSAHLPAEQSAATPAALAPAMRAAAPSSRRPCAGCPVSKRRRCRGVDAGALVDRRTMRRFATSAGRVFWWPTTTPICAIISSGFCATSCEVEAVPDGQAALDAIAYACPTCC